MNGASRGRPTFGPETRAAAGPWPFAIVALASFGAIAAALVTQHVYGMQPCPWCVLQRLIFVGIGTFALLGLAWRGPTGRGVAAAIALQLAVAGFTAAMWQHFAAAKSASCKLTLADHLMNWTGLNALLPDVFEARVSCADGAVTLFGVPYPFWSGGLFAVIAIVMIALVRRR